MKNDIFFQINPTTVLIYEGKRKKREYDGSHRRIKRELQKLVTGGSKFLWSIHSQKLILLKQTGDYIYICVQFYFSQPQKQLKIVLKRQR